VKALKLIIYCSSIRCLQVPRLLVLCNIMFGYNCVSYLQNTMGLSSQCKTLLNISTFMTYTYSISHSMVVLHIEIMKIKEFWSQIITQNHLEIYFLKVREHWLYHRYKTLNRDRKQHHPHNIAMFRM